MNKSLIERAEAWINDKSECQIAPSPATLLIKDLLSALKSHSIAAPVEPDKDMMEADNKRFNAILEAMENLRHHKVKQPQGQITPKEWQDWESERMHLLYVFWQAFSAQIIRPIDIRPLAQREWDNRMNMLREQVFGKANN